MLLANYALLIVFCVFLACETFFIICKFYLWNCPL